MGKADLHVHTVYSKDATTTVRAALKQASLIGLDVIAITDHDEIRGSLEARELASHYNLEVITGVEVGTANGHVLALFVDKPIPKGRPLIDTLLRIGELGGIAVAPHPINWLPGSMSMESVVTAIANEKTEKVLKGIEVFNMGHEIFNQDAQKFSHFLPLSKIAASDSHVFWTIGVGHTEFTGSSASDLRASLENFSTIPIASKKKFTLLPIIGWMGYITLRRFGYVAENSSPQDPVKVQRMRLNNLN